MLKEVRLPHILDALDHECETGNHQRYEILECARGIENVRSDILLTKQIKSDERSTGQRPKKDEVRLKYRELWSSARVIHLYRNLLNVSDRNQSDISLERL